MVKTTDRALITKEWIDTINPSQIQTLVQYFMNDFKEQLQEFQKTGKQITPSVFKYVDEAHDLYFKLTGKELQAK